MRCPFCANDDSQVKDSRPTEDGGAIRRRRQCPACGARFTTFERIQLRDMVVVKKSGKREPFDRDKLARSVEIACRKRPIEPQRIERLVNGVVRRLESSGDNELPVGLVGEMVMEGLQALDPVAYIRFASVYRDFREARDFETFVGALGVGALGVGAGGVGAGGGSSGVSSVAVTAEAPVASRGPRLVGEAE